MAINISNTGTTINSGTKLYIKTENQGLGKVLVSDSDGLVDWVGVKGLVSQDRYIGELYGGGIVVNIWQEGSNENVLIASLQDVSASDMSVSGDIGYVPPFVAQWSISNATFKGATSSYDGRFNTITARVGIPLYMFAQDSSAINFDGYGNLNGYFDWYLPSLYEMRAVWNSSAVINKVLGEHNFKFGVRDSVSAKYWTSTEVSATEVWQLDLTGTGNFATASKSSFARMRPVRVERKTIGNGLTTYLDATDKKSYNDSTLSGRWVDLINYGLTSSYSFTFSSINNTGPTYSPLQGGYMNFNGNSYVEFYSPIGDATTVTIEMWCRITPGYSNFMICGWNQYAVYFIDKLGFHTSNGGDFYGLTSTQVADLGLVNNWNHYVFEMRSDVPFQNNKIYVNGVQQTLTLENSENPANRNFNGGFGRIGSFRYRNDGYFAYCDISVFKVYKRSLTQTEINNGYNKYRRKYEIGIPSTNFIDMTTAAGTFSIVQNVKINVPGKKNLRVLRSNGSGQTSWVDKNYLFYRPDNQRFVGEYYGGGIIVSASNYPANVFNYTIMSTKDINKIVAELKYGGSVATRLMFSYNLSSWLSVGQIAKFVVAGSTKSLSITSVLPESSMVTIASATLNLPISDGLGSQTPGPALVSPPLFVDLQFVPTLIEVVVNINHLYVGDLIINLVAPNGNVMNLFNRQNGTGDNLTNTVFSSNLTLPIITSGTQPYTGTFRMNAVLGIITGAYTSNVNTLSGLLGGKTVNGNWYLVVVDGDVSIAGTLVNWSIRLTGTRTTVTLNETLTTTTTYESSKTIEIGTTGLSVPWSGNELFVTTNNYDGSLNNSTIVASSTHSAALLCDWYSSDGWGDWYLPSSMELVNAFDALTGVGYISGNDSLAGTYWTSTNRYFNLAHSVRVSGVGGTLSTVLINASKSVSNKVRAFRKVSILSNFKTWGETNPYDEPTGSWYTEGWDEKNWSGYPKVRSANLVFDFRTDNVFCYNGRFNGFSSTARSRVGSYTGIVLDGGSTTNGIPDPGVTWSSDEKALLFNGKNTGYFASNSVVQFDPVLSSTGVTPQPPLSFEVWLKPLDKLAAISGIISTDVVTTDSRKFGLNLNINGYKLNGVNVYTPKLVAGTGSTSVVGSQLSQWTGKPESIIGDVWNHLVVVMNSLNQVKFYVNGKGYSSILDPGSIPFTQINGSGPSNGISGKLIFGSYFNSLEVHKGYLSCVRIYTAELSEADVKNNFEYDRVRYGL